MGSRTWYGEGVPQPCGNFQRVDTLQQLVERDRDHDCDGFGPHHICVRVEAVARLPSRFGSFHIVAFWNNRDGKEHIVMVHGDNAWGRETLGEFFSHVGEADVIIGYTRRMARSQSWRRTAISKAFTLLVNLITDRRLQYYNGLQIHRAAVLKSLRIESSGYGFQAEVLVKSLRLTKTFLEVPMDLIERKKGESKAFRLKNVIDVARTVRLLYGLERTSTPERPSAPVPGR